MPWPPLEKNTYAAHRLQFHWDDVRREFAGLPDGAGFNMAHEAVDRHAVGPQGDTVALRWLGKTACRDYSYRELRTLSNRFANVLQTLGVARSERVFVLAGRIPELYITCLGTLKHTAVFCPLFSAFGPEPISARLKLGAGKVLVTTERLYQRKVAPIRDQLPELAHVLLIGEHGQPTAVVGTHDFHALLAAASPDYVIPPTRPADWSLLHFTSGTTGAPKGAVHVHEAALVHYLSGQRVLDLRPGDIFWCTADPGWVTGTSYGILAPLLHGVTNIVDEEEFNAERWYRILQEQGVNVWYTAPTAIRMLMKYGAELAQRYDLSRLRLLASVGEPLNPEAVVWGQQVFGKPFHDTWWQSETGGIMIANYPDLPVKPGSMGRPLPGIEAAIVRRQNGRLEFINDPNRDGELALKAGWPSMMRTYLNDEVRYRQCFVDGWYLSGDLARRDADGYYWFIGRADDVIKSAGHLIGPFEVESVLLEHPAVAEAGVIGLPDPVILETVKAYVALKPGVTADEALRRELMAHARRRLGPAVAPREIEFQDTLPKTRSGKIMRRLLRARALGLPEGDISTLENAD